MSLDDIVLAEAANFVIETNINKLRNFILNTLLQVAFLTPVIKAAAFGQVDRFRNRTLDGADQLTFPGFTGTEEGCQQFPGIRVPGAGENVLPRPNFHDLARCLNSTPHPHQCKNGR